MVHLSPDFSKLDLAMKRIHWPTLIRWVARISGTIVLLIPLIALGQCVTGDRTFLMDWRNIVLYVGLILGLSIAYRRELTGGIIVTLGVLISGFLHPLILAPGLFYLLSWFLHHRADQTSTDA